MLACDGRSTAHHHALLSRKLCADQPVCALHSQTCTPRNELDPYSRSPTGADQVPLVSQRNFPQEDPQVAELKLTEIESANITKQTLKAPGADNATTTSFHTFLDLHTPSTDLQPLKAQLKYERTCKAPKTGRLVTSSSKYQHYPVSIVGEHTVRIAWRSPSDRITPNIKTALKAFSRQGIRIDPLQKETHDLTKTASEQTAQDDQILQLAEHGNMLAAIKLTRKSYGMRLTEAKAFVEDLLQ
ncbi:Unannotated [Lentimonas sp. CC4]|nr:Unannotated [Lentimonas sp. CC4]CAA6685932.1 Unannotated [Lentimonas sp. CC6]CAA7075978.1 Unannotated [Lentimonas sp. CC4]CAA7168594.1 Unannotated [Lentimonas sp. CC21]CAA7180985.1 Unannotated [Lentimonas sp. CC8]